MATFEAGSNIALKLPPHVYDDTLAFYADVLGLERLDDGTGTPRFRFGGMTLWLDQVPALSQAEIWLEICTDDADAAAEVLQAAGIARADAIEPLPDGFDGFWVINPAGLVHLVHGPGG